MNDVEIHPLKDLKRLWHWLFDGPPAYIEAIAKMETPNEVRDALCDPQWRYKYEIPAPFELDLRERLVDAAMRQNRRRRRRKLLLNRISGMGLFGAWIVTFQHYNPGVPVNWIIGTIVVGGIGMVIYSYGD